MQGTCLVGRDHMNRKPCIDYVLYMVRETAYRVEYPRTFGQSLILYDLNTGTISHGICTIFECFNAPNV